MNPLWPTVPGAYLGYPSVPGASSDPVTVLATGQTIANADAAFIESCTEGSNGTNEATRSMAHRGVVTFTFPG